MPANPMSTSSVLSLGAILLVACGASRPPPAAPTQSATTPANGRMPSGAQRASSAQHDRVDAERDAVTAVQVHH